MEQHVIQKQSKVVPLHAMKPYGEAEVCLYSLLTRRYMEVSGQHHAPAALTSGKYPGTQWPGGRVGPKIGLDVLEKRQLPFLYWDSNLGPSSP